MQKFLNEAEDIRWCEDVHAKGFRGQFKSFIITGNEDFPEKLELFTSADPNVDEAPLVTIFNAVFSDDERK